MKPICDWSLTPFLLPCRYYKPEPEYEPEEPDYYEKKDGPDPYLYPDPAYYEDYKKYGSYDSDGEPGTHRWVWLDICCIMCQHCTHQTQTIVQGGV